MLAKHYTRRHFLKIATDNALGAGLFLAGLPHITCAAPTKTLYAYIGTSSWYGRGEGIYAMALDLTTGALTNNGPTVEAPSSSYLAAHPNKPLLYAVDGDRPGRISAYAIDKENRTLQLLNSQPTRGGGVCHVSLDQTGRWAFVANYGSGNLAVFSIGSDGQLGEANSVVQHAGTRPHVHMIIASPDNRFVLVANLGLDKIMVYAFDAEKGTLTPHATPWIQTALGAGPRHLAFHPDGRRVFAINEHDSTLSTDGRLQKRARAVSPITSTTIIRHWY